MFKKHLIEIIEEVNGSNEEQKNSFLNKKEENAKQIFGIIVVILKCINRPRKNYVVKTKLMIFFSLSFRSFFRPDHLRPSLYLWEDLYDEFLRLGLNITSIGCNTTTI